MVPLRLFISQMQLCYHMHLQNLKLGNAAIRLCRCMILTIMGRGMVTSDVEDHFYEAWSLTQAVTQDVCMCLISGVNWHLPRAHVDGLLKRKEKKKKHSTVP